MNALLAGATGLIGHALAAAWQGPGELHLVLRRPLAHTTALQRQHVVDFNALPALPPASAAFCCLGTTIKVAGSQAAFRAVDFTAVLAFARAAQAAGATRFAVVSALGADPAAGSFYNRVKGDMEAAVTALNFASTVVVRPSLLLGDRGALGQPGRPAERLAIALAGPLSQLLPLGWRPVAAGVVARAMLLAVAQGRPGLWTLDSAQLQALGRSAAPRVIE